MKIEDSYIAYCFDEAISEFIYRINDEQRPRFKRETRGENPGLKILLG